MPDKLTPILLSRSYTCIRSGERLSAEDEAQIDAVLAELRPAPVEQPIELDGAEIRHAILAYLERRGKVPKGSVVLRFEHPRGDWKGPVKEPNDLTFLLSVEAPNHRPECVCGDCWRAGAGKRGGVLGGG
jgi:hypothetical protein